MLNVSADCVAPRLLKMNEKKPRRALSNSQGASFSLDLSNSSTKP
jgi:hypothetical protein